MVTNDGVELSLDFFDFFYCNHNITNFSTSTTQRVGESLPGCALGRFVSPRLPAQRITAPMEAAIPVHIVATSGPIKFMVS